MRHWWRLELQQRVYRRVARRAGRVHGRGPLLVAIGDSNTDPCGYTLPRQVWLRIVGREGYRTLNLGVSGDTTADMRRRIEHTLDAGQPEIVVVFGGTNDVLRGVAPAETERNVTFIVQWLQDRGIDKVVLIGPGVLREVARLQGAIWLDLAHIASDDAAYVEPGDPHLNAQGHRRLAEAFLAATAAWRARTSRRGSLEERRRPEHVGRRA